MRSLAEHIGRRSEGRKVRFLGYGPGRFFIEDAVCGSGTSLGLPSMFDDDDGLVMLRSFRVVLLFNFCTAGSVVFINSPSVDNGIIEVDDVRDDFDWDGDMG